MKRFKKPKNKKPEQINIPTDFIMRVIMPCVMLACKDEFKIKDQDKFDKLNGRVNRYIAMVGDGTITEDQLHEFMVAVDSTKAMNCLSDIVNEVKES